MGKNNLKVLTAGLLIGASILGTSGLTINASNTHNISYAYVNEIKGASEVNIYNTALKNRLFTLLGKKTGDKLYEDDFINNDNYKVTTTTDSESGITKTSATRTYLDLSNANIKDITELGKFKLPTTLVAIDLSGNGITKNDVKTLQNVLNLNKDDEVTYGDTTFTCNADLASIIKKVNLTYNTIDLDDITTSALNNTKLLYGIQNINSDASGLIQKSALTNAKYYIRTDDNLYLSYNFYLNGSRYNYVQNTITNILSKPCGDFQIDISNPPSSETGYFYGYSQSNSFTVFDIYIKSTFVVERKDMFKLNVNSSSNMDIIIEGLSSNNCKITYLDPQTNESGTSYVTLKLEYNGNNKTLTLPFTVVDTKNPEITLKGHSKMYWRQNKPWVEPGYIGQDSGDNLTQLVDVDMGGLDVTTCGEYTIKYTLRDLAGNSAETKTRTVIIQEQVLDELVISSDKDMYNINDEVILTVQPASRTPITNYTDYKYEWYLDGVLFKTTTGDATTGKSSITIILDKSLGTKVTVKLTAKQKVDSSNIYVDSSEFEIQTKLNVSDNKSIIIACTIAIALVLCIIGVSYYLKARKSKNKISKSKKPKTNTNTSNTPKQNDIQVIKDYKDDKKDNK